MIVLGIDTATAVCGAGLAGDDGLIAERHVTGAMVHGEKLPGLVEDLFSSAGIKPAAIDGIAVSIGPGSFTGLRIGLGYAKGMALGLDKPLLDIDTMDGLIVFAPSVCEWGCVLLKARKGEVYQGLYRWQDGWNREGDFSVVAADQIGESLPADEVLFLGEGTTLYRDQIQHKFKKARFLQDESQPVGYHIASLGRDKLKQGHVADLQTIVPKYIKRFQGIA